MADKNHKDTNKHDKEISQAELDTSILGEKTPLPENPKSGLTEVENSMRNRSGNSIPKGGQNNEQGNPQPGYYTEAPGHQNGGQR